MLTEVPLDKMTAQISGLVSTRRIDLLHELALQLAFANVAYVQIGAKIAVIRVFMWPQVPFL